MIPLWGAVGLVLGAFVLGVAIGVQLDSLARWLAKGAPND